MYMNKYINEKKMKSHFHIALLMLLHGRSLLLLLVYGYANRKNREHNNIVLLVLL